MANTPREVITTLSTPAHQVRIHGGEVTFMWEPEVIEYHKSARKINLE